MDKEFDKTKVYTSLNITKDLIGAKGYYEDVLEILRDFPNNENLTIGEVVDFNDNVIFIRDEDGYINSSGWQFFYLVEMPKEKAEMVAFDDCYDSYGEMVRYHQSYKVLSVEDS